MAYIVITKEGIAAALVHIWQLANPRELSWSPLIMMLIELFYEIITRLKCVYLYVIDLWG